MKTKWLTAMIVSGSVCSSIFAMSGKAVAIIGRTPLGSLTSRMILANVSDNAVTSDTILKGEPGKPFFYPVFNNDGTRVAFYKDGAGVCVLSLADRSVRTVAVTGSWGGTDNNALLAWPGAEEGKWIYYHMKRSQGKGSGEIWKVNVDDTTQNSMVCDYIKTDDVSFINRWGLSADGQSACVFTNVHQGSAYTAGAYPHLFPPKVDPVSGWWNPILTAPTDCCNFASECNQGITASGKLLYHFSGHHTAVNGITWNHTTQTTTAHNPRAYFNEYTTPGLESWLAAGPAKGPELTGQLHYPRGSSNSDKIFTVVTVPIDIHQILYEGGNLAVVNWKDGQAVQVTSNESSLLSNGSCCISQYWVAEPGDFHLNGGPANSFQDENGNWITLPTTQISSDGGAIRQGIRARTATAVSTVAIYNLRGARTGIIDAIATTRKARTGLHRGIYFVSAGNCHAYQYKYDR